MTINAPAQTVLPSYVQGQWQALTLQKSRTSPRREHWRTGCPGLVGWYRHCRHGELRSHVGQQSLAS